MIVESIHFKNKKLKVNVKNADLKLLNTIRRYFTNKVPVLAIDKIIVYENKSSFFDEYIAHRIGLIPLSVKGKVKAENVNFTLDAEGPKTVYSHDLISSNKNVTIAVKNIPIIKLLKGQTLRIECKLKYGVGREHAKFQHGISYYDDKSITFEGIHDNLNEKELKLMVDKTISTIINDLKELNKYF